MGHPEISVQRCCQLFRLPRSNYYRGLAFGLRVGDLELMRRIDELYIEHPWMESRTFVGSPEYSRIPGGKGSYPPLDAGHGHRVAGSQARYQQAAAETSDLSLSVAGHDHRKTQSGLGNRHHLYSHGAGIYVPNRNYGLGHQKGPLLATVKYIGHQILR